ETRREALDPDQPQLDLPLALAREQQAAFRLVYANADLELRAAAIGAVRRAARRDVALQEPDRLLRAGRAVRLEPERAALEPAHLLVVVRVELVPQIERQLDRP